MNPNICIFNLKIELSKNNYFKKFEIKINRIYRF